MNSVCVNASKTNIGVWELLMENDILWQMKAEKGDKLVKKCCRTC